MKPDQIALKCAGNGPTTLRCVDWDDEFIIDIGHEDGEGLEIALLDSDVDRLIEFLQKVMSKR